MRIGIFGGSFDPVHLGHLWIAEAATESLQLDRLLWVPTATQPLKPGGAVASAEDRLAMLRLAIAGREGHEIDRREVDRDGVSFTIDTVSEIQQQTPGAALFLVVGSDSLASMRQWRMPERLLGEVTLAVVQRGGEKEIDFAVLDSIVPQDRINVFRQAVIKMPVIEISSNEIRRRVGQGSGIRHLVPRAVEVFIQGKGLYR